MKIKVVYSQTGKPPWDEHEIETAEFRHATGNRIVISLVAGHAIMAFLRPDWQSAIAFHVIEGGVMYEACRIIRVAGDCTLQFIGVGPAP